MSTATTPATSVPLYDAKTHLSELGERAAAGEEIIVTKHGKPRFKLVAVDPPKRRPLPGSIDLGAAKEQWTALAEYDWFAPDEEIERLFGTRE
ncbi:MAG: Antitoxin [Glaciihabitans sp.]|jgi:prevent-host-death family protein|nr:Antitoxin [Glaciihabitans sp.]